MSSANSSNVEGFKSHLILSELTKLLDLGMPFNFLSNMSLSLLVLLINDFNCVGDSLPSLDGSVTLEMLSSINSVGFVLKELFLTKSWNDDPLEATD